MVAAGAIDGPFPVDRLPEGARVAVIAFADRPEVVVDAFHVVRLGNVMVDEVRRRVQHETLGHRGHKGDPLYGIRRLLLTGDERLSDRGRVGSGDCLWRLPVEECGRR
jgi:CTP:molybdopterin cytidylyltransferase MocA